MTALPQPALTCPSRRCDRAGRCGPVLGVPGSSTCSCPYCRARATGSGRDLITTRAAGPAQLEIHPTGAQEDIIHAAA